LDHGLGVTTRGCPQYTKINRPRIYWPGAGRSKEKEMEDNEFMDESIKIVMKIAYWARKYPELYESGPARNTIANHLAELFTKLDELRKNDN
jgi:hypothetical protein